MLFDCTLPLVELGKLESVLSSPTSALLAKFMYYPKSFVILLTILIASSPGVDSIPGSYWQLLICSVLSWDCSIVIPSSDSTSNSSSLFPPYVQLFPPLKSWPPQSQPWGLESTSSSRWIYFIQKVIGIYFIQKVKCLCWYFDLFSWITNVLHGT